MSATLLSMPKKTEQIRLPIELVKSVRSTSSVLGESVPEYIARVVREALKKDMPRAAKLFAKQAEHAGEEDQPDTD